MPALEAAYEKFLERVHEETDDPDWAIDNHPARAILERFDPHFGGWVNHLMELDWIRKAGYPLAANDLSYAEWKCLAIVKQWRRAKAGEGHRDDMQ